jgi:hypothetical protein
MTEHAAQTSVVFDHPAAIAGAGRQVVVIKPAALESAIERDRQSGSSSASS